MAENIELIQQAFRVLHPKMLDYITTSIRQKHGENWWKEILYVLSDQKKNLPETGTDEELMDALDIANCLRLMDRLWNDIFRIKLAMDYRTWSRELMGVRNKMSHIGLEDFSQDDTWRYLDTIARLCEAFDEESAETIRAMLRKLRYGSEAGSGNVTTAGAVSQLTNGKKVKNVGIIDSATTFKGLPSWRDIIEPHPDVAQGRYKNAEFAADLAQVARGEGSIEYRDPVEFFSRTFVTEGMTGLLVQSLKRITGQGGEPVIQLKTAFGGGKTHSMLALYHMLRGKATVAMMPNLKPVLQAAGLKDLPRANVAVLVGTAIDPARSRRPPNLPGVTINTLWGEMAAQLALGANDLKLYDFVKEADKKGISPGSKAFKDLFDACGPCLILMDELVAYAKKLYGVKGLPAGEFDNFITFIQEITEAARASENSLVVASIPESDLEIGGEAGRSALEAIEHTFGRMESIWKPVASNEGFEVVRRRLFLNCKDPDGRERVCAQFSKFYFENASDFPQEAREVDYQERMVSCYPIHPEIFDRLYNDWSTLERFQRTRGVLRLMAAVIHELWMGNDASAMIMPGSIPLSIQNVSYELTRHLGDDNWNAIIDSEVDGKNSVPYRKDMEVQRYGSKMAARRVARAIFMGSAPTSRSQAVRGLEALRIRLGVIQPGENIPDFNDALNALRTSLAYLYSNPSGYRFWYDTRPTLRKTAEDRATQQTASDIEYEIETRLRAMRKEKPFAGLHTCPGSSLDVTDDQEVRLVILHPRDTYNPKNQDCPAMLQVNDILNNRGSSPRIFRNMLAFVAPDQEGLKGLKDGVKQYLAWCSIKEDVGPEGLNLDANQIRETENNLRRSNDTVNARIQETYRWLLVPTINRFEDMKSIAWEATNISGGNKSIVAKAANKMLDNETLISKWAPALLLMELDNLLWKETDHIQISKLWEYLCTYCYLPRLTDYSVLEDAVATGVNSSEYFAVAKGYSGGRYLELRLNQHVGLVEKSELLVKISVAKQQIEKQKEEACKQGADDSQTVTTPGTGASSAAGMIAPAGADTATNGNTPQQTRKTCHFHLSAPLDNTRINRDVHKLVEEIISHLVSMDDCKVKLTLNVTANSAKGFSQPIIRTVSENCRTLHLEDFEFNEN